MRSVQRSLATVLLALVAAPAACAAPVTGDTIDAARAAIRQEIPGAHHVYVACRKPSATSIHGTCRATWAAHERRYVADLHMRLRQTPQIKSYRYTLRGSSYRSGTQPGRFRRRGNIAIEIPVGSTRENPVPLGTAGIVGEWAIRVLDVTVDATDAVMATDPYQRPDVGTQYFLVRVAATYNGTGSDQLAGGVEFNAVGSAAVGYDGGASCPIDGLDSYRDVFAGGTLEGSVCWTIASTDAASLAMYVGDGLLVPTTWFALR